MRYALVSGRALALGSLLLLTAGSALAAPAPRSFRGGDAVALDRVARVELSQIDNHALTVAAERTEGFTGPWQFAERRDLQVSPATVGTWETLGDGSRLWRARFASPGALSLSLHFARFTPPPGARLWVYDGDRSRVWGPYRRGDANAFGELWTPLVESDEIVAELWLPGRRRSARGIEIAALSHGFRGPGAPPDKGPQGPCNIDVRCPEGGPWRAQAQAVLRMVIQGRFLCTGSLINNTAQDLAPYVLSAYHCMDGNTSLAPATVYYFNYESPACGQRSGGSLAQSITGSTYVASEPINDFLLLRLDRVPDIAFNPYWLGWNATGETPPGGVGIHHPVGGEKSISFDDHPLTTSTFADPYQNHWKVGAWEKGTTEGGSSGSCIFDPRDGLCVGQLHGGFASCDDLEGADFYGKLSASWEGGGTPQTRLRDWLDPVGTGVRRLGGRGPAAGPALSLLDGRFRLEATWRNQFDGSSGAAIPVPSTNLSGFFYFTDPSNLELMVKMLDFGDRILFFYGQLTNLEFTITVTDNLTGERKAYQNGPNNCGAIDQNAFPGGAAASGAGGALDAFPGAGIDGAVMLYPSTKGGGELAAANCVATANRLCLLGNRIAVELDWRNQFDESRGVGKAGKLSNLTGSFAFTDPSNLEILVKALDFGDRILVLWGALSNLEYTLHVTYTPRNERKDYHNPAGQYCGGLDPNAFVP